MTEKDRLTPDSAFLRPNPVFNEIVDASQVKQRVLDLIGSEEEQLPSSLGQRRVYERRSPSGRGTIRVVRHGESVIDVFDEGERIDGIRVPKPGSGDFRLRRARAIRIRSRSLESYDLFCSLRIEGQLREASITVVLRHDQPPRVNFELASTSSRLAENTVYGTGGPDGMSIRRVRQIARAFGVTKPQ
jgi:hypothetical protein